MAAFRAMSNYVPCNGVFVLILVYLIGKRALPWCQRNKCFENRLSQFSQWMSDSGRAQCDVFLLVISDMVVAIQ